MSATSDFSPGAMESLIASYQRDPALPDELLDANGAVRPAWRTFMDGFARLAPEDVSQRIARGDQYLREAGVYYRQFGDDGSVERAWPLSHMPVLIHENEWFTLVAALEQRAELLEAVARDLYGTNRLVADGHLPASLVASSAEWLRPLVGVEPAGGSFLSFIAFEVGRGPDGTWWVFGDRVQAPSGAAFALENRLATSHIFQDLYGSCNVHRLAPFFQSFRDALLAQRTQADSIAGVLTPGVMTDTYFEHAYIARYLGLTLLEGEDLSIETGKVWVRTVEGLKPVGVLWRRMDALFADPLELDPESQLGAPGLVSALRTGAISMVNALGVGVLEARALLAFMPRICEALLGEALLMPNVATWWCGDDEAREYVRAHAESLVLAPAHSTRRPFDVRAGDELSGRARDIDPAELDAALAQNGARYVAQEAARVSKTPVFGVNGLEPRPVSLRIFFARTPNGWMAMPGGYARIGRRGESDAISLSQGGSVADVWVVGDQPARVATLMSTSTGALARAKPGALPSRSADNLYWLGRFIERAEALLRVRRAYHVRLSEGATFNAPVVAQISNFLFYIGDGPRGYRGGGLAACIDGAQRCAAHVRDCLSVDAGLSLKALVQAAPALDATWDGLDSVLALNGVLRQIASINGHVQDNAVRTQGWRFLNTGRALERSMQTITMLLRFTDPAGPVGGYDAALEIADSSLTHRELYAMSINRASVLDVVCFDTRNPRALIYQLSALRTHLEAMPSAIEDGVMSAALRAAMQIQAELIGFTPETIHGVALEGMWNRLSTLSNLLTAQYLR